MTFDHLLVMTSRAGYWGRGKTFAEAVENARYLKASDEVLVIPCTGDATVDQMGRAYGTDMTREPIVGRLSSLRRRSDAFVFEPSLSN